MAMCKLRLPQNVSTTSYVRDTYVVYNEGYKLSKEQIKHLPELFMDFVLPSQISFDEFYDNAENLAHKLIEGDQVIIVEEHCPNAFVASMLINYIGDKDLTGVVLSDPVGVVKFLTMVNGAHILVNFDFVSGRLSL